MPIKVGAAVCLIAAALWPVPVLAYIDPGTGSILIQGIIAAIAALGVTLKLYWHRFTGFFRGKSTRQHSREDPRKKSGPKQETPDV